MKQKDIILYASIAGGAYLAYWYVTNYGPGGSIAQGAVSYWDSWFNSAQPSGAVSTFPTQDPNAGTRVTGGPATTPNQTQTPPPTPSTSLRDKMVSASGNATTLNAHQWNYYRNQLAPPAWTPEQMASVFPGDAANQLMTVDQFLSAAHAIGLAGVGAIVPTASMSQIPSMTFGGNFKSFIMMSGGGGMKGPVN